MGVVVLVLAAYLGLVGQANGQYQAPPSIPVMSRTSRVESPTYTLYAHQPTQRQAPRRPQPLPPTLLPPEIRLTAYQPTPSYSETDEETAIEVQLQPPGLERLIGSLRTEEALRKKIRQENRDDGSDARIVFPDEPILSREPYRGRGPVWPHRNIFVEPNYLIYDRPLFEQLYAERYGWDLGLFHPALSAGLFVKDFVTLPYHLATEPYKWTESNAGYCLPGDPVPLMLHPPKINLPGTAAELVTILTLVAIFP